MITLEHDQLTFRFPDVHADARCSIEFQRTLRIPDDDRTYYLPPGLGRFPLRHLDDFADRLKREMVRRGGVVMPIHQAEALWISFDVGYDERFRHPYPVAVKIATGKICAISGQPWEEGLSQDPQNYVVLPEQPWLDGYCVEEGVIRQFVAMPLGDGYTAEEQLTGEAVHGGLQIAAYPMKRKVFDELLRRYEESLADEMRRSPPPDGFDMVCSPPAKEMGLAPGGRMRQEIYDDPHGLDVWDQEHGSRCFVTMANSAQWMAITGEHPPTVPPTARQYAKAGLPWFDYYDADHEAIAGAEELAGLKSVKAMGQKLGKSPLPENESSGVPVVVLKPKATTQASHAGKGEGPC
ncbi:MAG: hypothetical protein OXN18_06345 [Gemmatimonadota bacterium]|nr:hypothetical protein [Gemmatimonadota bacterium]